MGIAVLMLVPSAGADVPAPLIGVTYTHFALTNCDLQGGTGIVEHYSDPGVRRRVRSQLAAMRAAGIGSIRTFLWFMSDASGQGWGVVSSAGGKLSEPERSNLIRFVSDVRTAGFRRLTVAFGPQWSNDPIGAYLPTGIEDHWDPTKLNENWSFIADVHRLVTPHAPADTVFDILSEVPPSQYQPQWAIDRLDNYIRTIWTRYADTFGLQDAVISVIAKDGQGPDRLQRLIDTLRSTGRGFPADFEIHADWTSPEAYDELEAVNDVLKANGLAQPIVVGEASYENAAEANDLARFVADSGRRVLEVFEWFQTASGGPCLTAPYRADAYISALDHVAPPPPTPAPLPLLPIPTLRASVSAAGVPFLHTASGTKPMALDAGEYNIIVTDRSRHAGFRLTGPGLDLTSGKRFVGSRRWRVELGIAAPYDSHISYGTDNHPTFTLTVR